ncbi:Protein argonaute 4 -like protein [Gossypium arboreum]|uniref:Protein argonaute 4-like protein n=1 Tax=Gossypium arboreum TaxID=29729 RepID=A0A0B0P9C5_GOSAR|nr:Protein argonaute 4 -like protein [Gossypium arboreum]
MLTLGQTPSIPVVSKVPTIILEMGALFGFPEQSDVPSTAAMVSSRRWPFISSYGASGRTQSLKLKMMILSSKPVSDKVDDGIIKEALLDFYTSSGKRKPNQIITFRDGGSPNNVLHGTFIDNKVCHPKNNDFYLGTHAGMIGTTRQTHYQLLLDQAGDTLETSLSHGGMYAPGVISIPQLSRLKDEVSNFILVC